MATRRADFELGVGADIAALREELAKVPGITEAEAKKMAKALDTQMKRAEKAAKKAAKNSQISWRKLKNTIGLVTTAVAGASAAFLAAGQAQADYINDINDLSTRSGVASETIAGLKLAAEGAGLSFGEIKRVLATLPVSISAVEQGTGKQAEAFERLGVQVRDSSGEMRSADDILRDYLTAVAAVESPTERAVLMTDAFGTSGTKLLQALGDPSALDHFVSQAQMFGLDVGGEAAQSAADWQREVALLGTALKGAGADLADSFGTSATGILRSFGETAVFAMTFVSEIISTVIDDFGDFGKSLVSLGGPIADLLGALTSGDWGAAQDAIKGLADAAWAAEKAGYDLANPFDNFSDALEGAAEKVHFLQVAAEEEIPSSVDMAASLADVADTADNASASVADLADEMSPLERAIAGATSALEALGDTLAGLASTADQGWLMDLLGDASAPLSDMEELQARAADLAIALSRHPEYADELTAALEETQAEMDALLATTLDEAEAMAEAARSDQWDALSDTISTMGGSLSDIVGMLAGPVAGAIVDLAVSFSDVISGLQEELVTLATTLDEAPEAIRDLVISLAQDVIPAIIEAIPDLVTGIVEAIPDIITGIIDALPRIVTALIHLLLSGDTNLYVLAAKIALAVAEGIWDVVTDAWAYFSSGQFAVDLFDALKSAWDWLWDLVLNAIPNFVSELWHSITEVDWSGLLKKAGDTATEILTLGIAKTETYGDTPGIVHVPSSSRSYRFSPGDQVVAARSTEGLLSQVLDGMSPAPAAASADGGSISYRDTHRLFEAFVQDHLRTTSTLASVTGHRVTGRANPYRSS